jgi:hypothetical protein
MSRKCNKCEIVTYDDDYLMYKSVNKGHWICRECFEKVRKDGGTFD